MRGDVEVCVCVMDLRSVWELVSSNAYRGA